MLSKQPHDWMKYEECENEKWRDDVSEYDIYEGDHIHYVRPSTIHIQNTQ